MPVNWGLSQGNGFQNALAQGFQIGDMMRQRSEQRAERNALAAYATDPSEANLAGVAQYRPDYVIQERQRQTQAQQQGLDRQREQLPVVSRLLSEATPENWGQTLQRAQALGIDVSQVPAQYDAGWVQQTQVMAQALQTPQGAEALSSIGREVADMGYRPGTPEFSAKVTELYNQSQVDRLVIEPGASVVEYNPVTRETRQLVQPGNGGSPAPASGSAPPDAVAALLRGEGTDAQFDEMFGPGAAARARGGGSSNATGGFPGS